MKRTSALLLILAAVCSSQLAAQSWSIEGYIKNFNILMVLPTMKIGDKKACTHE